MNSSTGSASDFEYELIDNNNFVPYFYGRTGLHSTFAQPLVYYAEVKPKKRKQRSRENERHKSNCFVKAFRWYTQEHVPKNESLDNVEENSFANWLDEKYNEYLQKNQNEQCQVLRQASTLEIVNAAKNFETKQIAAKEYSSIKSPWKKRRKSMAAADKSDVDIAVSSRSVQIILKPKNLSRAASAYCLRVGPQCCCQTDVQKQSDGSALQNKSKSQSFTSLLTEKEIFIVPDIAQQTSFEKLKYNTNETKLNNNAIVERNVTGKNQKDVWCQCSKMTLEEIDDGQLDKKNSCHCLPKSEIGHPKKVSVIPTPRSNTKYQKINIINVEETGPPLAVFQNQKNNSCVQTSDNSIRLGYDMIHNYPLFMKMVCVHKSNENFN